MRCRRKIKKGNTNEKDAKNSQPFLWLAVYCACVPSIAGFELAWKLSVELNHYENERSVSCQTAMGSGARFASKEEEK